MKKNYIIILSRSTIKVFLFTSLMVFISCSDSGLIKNSLSIRSGEPVIPRDANTILIKKIEDNTFNKEFPVDELKVLINDTFIREGRLVPVQSADLCDLELFVSIIEYRVQDLSVNSVGIPLKKRISINTLIRLRETKTERIVFTNMNVQSFREFSESVPPIETIDTAMRRCVTELAERIASSVLTGWYTNRMTPAEKGKR